MKIAIILPTIISKNGTAKQAIELAKQLVNLGDEVEFVTFAYSKETSFEDFSNFTIRACINLRGSLIYKYVTKNLGILETIYLYIGMINIYQLVRAIQRNKYDIINPHDWFGIWVAKLANIGKIVANINDVPQRDSGIISMLKLFFDRLGKDRIIKVIVLDNNNKQKAINWLSVPEKKVVVIRSGIDISKYKNFRNKIDLRKEFGIQKDSFIIICANVLAPNRKYEEVITALSLLRNHKMHLFVLSKLDFNVQYAQRLKELVKKMELEKNVHFIDKFFKDEERMGYIAGGDILIFSNYPQTWGLTVIEAMALGLPVIVSRGSGVSEVIKNGRTGLLYDVGDINGLAKIIMKVMNNKEHLNELSVEGRKYVLDTYSWEKFGKNVRNIFINN